MCICFTEIKHKQIFGIKHITQIKRYAIRRQMNVCKHIFSYFLSNSYIVLKIALPVILLLIVSFFMVTQNTQFSRTNYKRKIKKTMFIHILNMTLNKVLIKYFAVIMPVYALLSTMSKLSSTIKGWGRAFWGLGQVITHLKV